MRPSDIQHFITVSPSEISERDGSRVLSLLKFPIDKGKDIESHTVFLTVKGKDFQQTPHVGLHTSRIFVELRAEE